jgi:hypothetical protein
MMWNFSQLVIPVVSLMTLAVNAWINFQIKFAPSREAAIHDLKRIAGRIWTWGINGLNVYFLVGQVFSSAPVTRGAVCLIAAQVTSIGVVIVTTLMILTIKSNNSARDRMREEILAISHRLHTTDEALLMVSNTLGRAVDAIGQYVAITHRLTEGSPSAERAPASLH